MFLLIEKCLPMFSYEHMHFKNLKLIPDLLIWVQKKNVPKKVPDKKYWQRQQLQYPKSPKFAQFFTYSPLQRIWNQHSITVLKSIKSKPPTP
jgi:hypothetical protein